MKNMVLVFSTFLFALFLVTNGVFAAYGPKITEMGNKHNLSYANTAVTFRASDPNDPRGREICIFCHTPHNATQNRGLWNRQISTQAFGHYTATAMRITSDLKGVSDYNEPNGASRLCLGCHDGVTALGAVYRGSNIAITNGPAMSGTNVFDRTKITNSHHPVSFNYNQVQAALGYKELQPNSNVKLDHQGRMQCTTCHDPHQTKDTTMPFWVWEYVSSPSPPVNNSQDAVCLSCH